MMKCPYLDRDCTSECNAYEEETFFKCARIEYERRSALSLETIAYFFEGCNAEPFGIPIMNANGYISITGSVDTYRQQ